VSAAGRSAPRSSEETLRHRTLVRRIVAALIDLALLELLWGAHRWVRDQDPHVVLFVLWYVVLRVLLVAYGIVAHARWGQTLGKKLRSLRLMNAGEDRLPTLRQCILRDIVPVAQLPVFLALAMPDLLAGHDPTLDEGRLLQRIGMGWVGTLWVLAELVTMFKGRNGRSLQDYIAGTVVVRTDVPGAETGARVTSDPPSR
jgi:uncharacterized RDD family membrane protein YckC